MNRLLYFIRKSYVAIIFIMVEIFAIRSYALSTPYTEARLQTVAHAVTGYVRNFFSSFDSYFSLRKKNVILTERIALLENEYQSKVDTIVSSEHSASYEYIAARVVANSIHKPHNMLTINKGFEDGVIEDMSVITPDGYAVGVIISCSAHFAIAKSILHTDFRLSARLGEDSSIGSVHWNGGDYTEADLDNISKYAKLKVGQKIYTTGFSHFFPEGLEIGEIKKFHLPEGSNTYKCLITLSADINRLQNVLLIHNKNLYEVIELEKNTEE